MTYSNYLNTWHWLKTKSQLKRKFGSCYFCGCREGLQVHHIRYKTKNGASLLFKESERDLIVLCQQCHKDWHKLNTLTQMKKRIYSLIRHFVRTNHMTLADSYKLVVSHQNQIK